MQQNQNFSKAIEYTLKILGQRTNVNFEFVNTLERASIRIDTTEHSSLPIAENFYQQIDSGIAHFTYHFVDDCYIKTDDGRTDYLATAFYMINSLQEYHGINRDALGRFRYIESYQFRFNNITENLVEKCFQQICKMLSLPLLEIKPSRIYLTHDIDSIFGALTQDSYYLIKRMRPLPILRLMLNALLRKPDWLTMEQIMNIEDEYSLKSTFYWLVNKDKVSKGVANADYSIRDPLVTNSMKSIQLRGFENGLHKSISSDSYQQEIKKLGVPVFANRNHYLCLTLPDHYELMDSSGLLLDTTLGFAEQYGFRNSYGLPFTPFNIKSKTPYSFVEAPLHIMDGTFHKYQKMSLGETTKAISDFIDKNKSNSVIAVLWHNTFFSKYKFDGYLAVYKKMLELVRELKIQGITSREIYDDYILK